MAIIILIRVLEEISQDGHCEALDRLRDHGAIVTKKDNGTNQVYGVALVPEDATILRADLALLDSRGNIETITPLDHAQELAHEPSPESGRPSAFRPPGGPPIH